MNDDKFYCDNFRKSLKDVDIMKIKKLLEEYHKHILSGTEQKIIVDEVLDVIDIKNSEIIVETEKRAEKLENIKNIENNLAHLKKVRDDYIWKYKNDELATREFVLAMPDILSDIEANQMELDNS